MKKSEPKMILNVSIENEELQNKVKIAMDKYAEALVQKNLDDIIRKIVVTRIDRLVKDYRWGDEGKIDGKPLNEYVKEKTEDTIKDVIDKNIKSIFVSKVADMLSE